MRDDLVATTICLKCTYDKSKGHRWGAELTWVDSKWAVPGSIQGTIETRYTNRGSLNDAIDDVLQIAKQFGIPLGEHFGLWVQGNRDCTSPSGMLPNDWRTLVVDEAERRGWKSYSRKAPDVC